MHFEIQLKGARGGFQWGVCPARREVVERARQRATLPAPVAVASWHSGRFAGSQRGRAPHRQL